VSGQSVLVALAELIETVEEICLPDEVSHSLHAMVDGKRLRDISDLPLDLAI